ncbi:SseB family protein [Nonomuraea sp. PA05]|uniref:SseB family protein n=1 Tax=Nonomuraea sp. PA05 TaxID=2604466 RepID=UPI0011DA73AB|nr:SseB family protein [Nonomuraea sp. PA05]TYB64373.1 SseB family protein [Nonomuraea sp. PA05]
MRAPTPMEERLQEAHERGDLTACLTLLRFADFACPVSDAAARGEQQVAWPTVTGADRVWVAVYTSAEAMREATGGAVGHFRVLSLVELAAGWPDPRWGLAVNPGCEPSFLLEPGTLARLAVPTLEQDLAAEPGSGIPIVQKLLQVTQLQELLDEEHPLISGYCHHALDVAHIATPSVLADALLQEDTLTAQGAVNLLRWPAIGLELYRTPYGGTDEAGRAAVAGWVVEEAPFAGMGLVANASQTIREYKIDAIALPHAAEIVELAADGQERTRARYDADHGRWILVEGE